MLSKLRSQLGTNNLSFKEGRRESFFNFIGQESHTYLLANVCGFRAGFTLIFYQY